MRIKPIVVFKTVISIGLLVLIFSRIDIAQTWNQLKLLSLPFVAFSLIYYAGLQYLSCLRWQTIIVSTKNSVSIIKLLKSYFAGMFLNLFLPGSLGGDVYRVYHVAKEIQDSEVALVSVFLERFTGLAALSALAVLGLAPAIRVVGRWDILVLFFGCVGALVGGVLLIVSPKLLILAEPLLHKFRLNNLASRLAKIQILLREFAQNRQALALSMGLSFLLQLGIVYYHYLIAQELKISISYLELLVFIPIIVVITLLPISLGGIGLKEGLWVYLFSRIGLPSEQALLLSVIITILSWLLCLVGGLILLLDSAGWQFIKNKNTNL